MFNDSLASGSEIWIIFNASLHLVQQVFIHPAGYPSALPSLLLVHLCLILQALHELVA
jgi:hypothetical protein